MAPPEVESVARESGPAVEFGGAAGQIPFMRVEDTVVNPLPAVIRTERGKLQTCASTPRFSGRRFAMVLLPPRSKFLIFGGTFSIVTVSPADV